MSRTMKEGKNSKDSNTKDKEGRNTKDNKIQKENDTSNSREKGSTMRDNRDKDNTTNNKKDIKRTQASIEGLMMTTIPKTIKEIRGKLLPTKRTKATKRRRRTLNV